MVFTTLEKRTGKAMVAVVFMITLVTALMSGSTAWAADTVTAMVGNTTTVTSTLDYDAATCHIDYTVADSKIASVNKHKGVITGQTVGTTTVTAHVVNKPYVSGGGTGDGGLCADEVAGKTESWTVSIVAADQSYGLQGTGGLHIKMLSPVVTSVSMDASGNCTNTIGVPMAPCDHGFVTFTYEQDGALNNGIDTYLANSAAHISVLAEGSATPVAQLAKTGALTATIDAAKGTVTLKLDTSVLGGATKGTLLLGKGIGNNNGSKTIGVDLAFPFSLGKAESVPVTDAAVLATCTTTGLTEGSHCGVCGAAIMAQEETPALGHTPVTDPAVPATCTATGLTEGSHCGVCGETIVAQTEVAALPHSPVADPAVKATYTTFGKTAGSHCGSCGTVLVAPKQVKKLQKITASTLTLSVKAGKTSAKKTSVSAKGTLSYKKTSGKKGLSVVRTKGGFKIKAAKGLKRGTYTVKVRINAGATSTYQAATKTVSVKVRVTK